MLCIKTSAQFAACIQPSSKRQISKRHEKFAALAHADKKTSSYSQMSSRALPTSYSQMTRYPTSMLSSPIRSLISRRSSPVSILSSEGYLSYRYCPIPSAIQLGDGQVLAEVRRGPPDGLGAEARVANHLEAGSSHISMRGQTAVANHMVDTLVLHHGDNMEGIASSQSSK
jgi:hypothetical protein